MKINIKKLTAFIIVILPWIGNYRFFLTGLTLGDVALIVAMLLAIYKTKGIYKTAKGGVNNSYKVLLVYLLYGIFVTLVSLVIGDYLNYGNVAKRSIKLVLYFGTIIFLLPNWLDYSRFSKIYKYFVYVSCFAIVMQYVGYYLGGVYLEFKLPFLSYSNEAVQDFDFVASRLSTFRPDSIFLEPSHFVYYIIGYIPMTLFKYTRNTKNIYEAIFISLAVVMAKSSAAIFFLIFIWSFYVVQLLKNRKISIWTKNRLLIVLLITLSFLVILITNTNLFEAVDRMMFSSNSGLATSVWSKLDGGDVYNEQLTVLQKITGVGFGNYPRPTFATSINFIIFSTGYIGLFIVCLWVIKSYIQSNNVGKSMIVLSLMLFSAWYLIYSPTFILYCTIIIFNSNHTATSNCNSGNAEKQLGI